MQAIWFGARGSVTVRLVCLGLALAALGLGSCQKQAEKGAEGVAPHIDSVASADGVMIHYETRGVGDRALVFVHCWNCDRCYWEGQLDEFSKDYHVVALDLAGHGESGMGREVWSMEAYGADVAAVANKLGLKEIILVGHSMGGPVCIEAARLLGDKVTAIVGVDTFQDLTQKMTEEQKAQMLAPFLADFSSTTEMFVRSLFPVGSDSSLVDHVAKDMAAGSPDVGLGSFDHLFSYDATEALKDVRVPIRCINSDRFPTNVEGNRQVAESFDVVYMKGHGHFLHMADSETFNRLLRETISEFWPTEGSH